MPYKDAEDRRAAWRRCYNRNRTEQYGKTKARQAKHRLRNQEYLHDWLVTHPCVDCGEGDWVVLEFDHLGLEPKHRGVCVLADDACSLATLRAEIAKCEVVCANCHKRRTSQRGNHWRCAYSGS